MTDADLNRILELHQKWLNNEDGGERADLRGADLCDADLCDANLRRADLRGANLSRAGLRDANLRDANLRGANLRDANLRGADLDFSCWPLWCGSLDTKIDTRIATQLLYHLMRACKASPDVSDAFKAALFTDALISEANNFHRVNECGRINGLNEEG